MVIGKQLIIPKHHLMFWNDVLKITILEYYYEKVKKYSIIPKHHMMFWNDVLK